MIMPQRSWIEISEAALAHNLRALQRAAGPDTEVLAVVKANAYGHGAELCAQVLARAGARSFGVTDVAEGARVRGALQRAGFSHAEILVMCGSLPEETATIAEHDLTPVVWTVPQVEALHNLTRQKIQIEIDTGMGRQGARPGQELDALLAAISAANVTLNGVFTHLCSSEVANSPRTEMQKQRFEQAVNHIRVRGLQPKLIHIGNSSAIDNPSDPGEAIGVWLTQLAQDAGARAMVRSGLALYGYVLPIEGLAPNKIAPALRPNLRPALAWKARILAIHTVAPGETIGYGATFTAPAPMRVALLPVGYADGLRRELSSPSPAATARASEGGWVIAYANGAPHRCPILGRVSMNLTVVDVTGVSALAPGDPVTVLGDGITADDHARIARTIPYEILCGLKTFHTQLT
ncbi:MAG: alanine racemase [Acidobacteriaceae bacterium]